MARLVAAWILIPQIHAIGTPARAKPPSKIVTTLGEKSDRFDFAPANETARQGAGGPC